MSKDQSAMPKDQPAILFDSCKMSLMGLRKAESLTILNSKCLSAEIYSFQPK